MRNPFLIYFLDLVILSCSPETSNHKSHYANTADFVQFRLVDDASEGDSEAVIAEDTGEELFLRRRVLLNLNDVSHAQVRRFRNTYHVDLVFTRIGKWKFSEITGNNVGKRLGVLVDGNLLSASRINEQIDTGEIPLIRNLVASEVERLTSRINAILTSLPKAEQTDTEDTTIDSLYLIDKLNLEGPYLFEPLHISEVIELEESLGSKRHETWGPFQIKMPGTEIIDFVQPLEYDRPRTGHITPHVMYAFSKPDSVVRFIEYAFMVELKNLKERELAEEHYFRLDEGVYPRLKAILISKLGKPVQDDVLQELKETEESTVQIKMSSWKKANMTLFLSVGDSQPAGVQIYLKH